MVLAINLGEKPEVIAGWVKSRGVTATVLLDPSGETARSYQVAYTPMVFLIDRQGKLIAKVIGERQWSGDQGQALLRALLARKS